MRRADEGRASLTPPTPADSARAPAASTPADASPHAGPAARPDAAPDAPPTPASDALHAAILASLEDDKAEDIVSIELRGRSEMGDWMVVATGRSTRQVAAIADHLAETLKHDHGVLARTEGKETADWVLVDAGDVIVHVFRPEVRDFYQLEKMWLPAESQGASPAGAAPAASLSAPPAMPPAAAAPAAAPAGRPADA